MNYKVTVTYKDAQPGEETYTLTNTYRIEADCEADAEQIAMERCAQDFLFSEPIEATAQEFCFLCRNTGYVNDGPDDVRPCEGDNHLDERPAKRSAA